MQQYQNQVQEVFAPIKEFSQRKFMIQKQIGKGGQGFVYLAKCINWGNNTNKEVALKIQDQRFVSQKEIDFLQILIGYQNSKQELNYPCNMIQVLDQFIHEQKYFVTVMEKGEEDLYHYLNKRQQPLSDQEKIKICQDITKPIYFLHSNGYTHRDIKPENYIKVADKFKLIDFGLVKHQQSRIMTIGVGTPLYQAPEIVNQGQQYTEKVDIWSLACVFYEIFTSQALFDYKTLPEISKKILNHLNDQNEVFNKINRMKCNQEIKLMIIQMLQPNPKQRINSKEVMEILAKVFQPNVVSDVPENIQQTQNQLKENLKQFINLEIRSLEQQLTLQVGQLNNQIDQQALLYQKNLVTAIEGIKFEIKSLEKKFIEKTAYDKDQFTFQYRKENESQMNQIAELKLQIIRLSENNLNLEMLKEQMTSKQKNELEQFVELKNSNGQLRSRVNSLEESSNNIEKKLTKLIDDRNLQQQQTQNYLQTQKQCNCINQMKQDFENLGNQIISKVQNDQTDKILQLKEEIQRQIDNLNAGIKNKQDTKEEIGNLEQQIGLILLNENNYLAQQLQKGSQNMMQELWDKIKVIEEAQTEQKSSFKVQEELQKQQIGEILNNQAKFNLDMQRLPTDQQIQEQHSIQQLKNQNAEFPQQLNENFCRKLEENQIQIKNLSQQVESFQQFTQQQYQKIQYEIQQWQIYIKNDIQQNQAKFENLTNALNEKFILLQENRYKQQTHQKQDIQETNNIITGEQFGSQGNKQQQERVYDQNQIHQLNQNQILQSYTSSHQQQTQPQLGNNFNYQQISQQIQWLYQASCQFNTQIQDIYGNIQNIKQIYENQSTKMEQMQMSIQHFPKSNLNEININRKEHQQQMSEIEQQILNINQLLTMFEQNKNDQIKLAKIQEIISNQVEENDSTKQLQILKYQKKKDFQLNSQIINDKINLTDKGKYQLEKNGNQINDAENFLKYFFSLYQAFSYKEKQDFVNDHQNLLYDVANIVNQY